MLPNSQDENSNGLTSSQADSPARIFPKPESVPVSRETARAFGLNSPVSLGSFDPDTFLLKTFQVSLIDGLCQELSENWPDSGMWDLGFVFELQTSAPPIFENEFLLWRTACERDHHPSRIEGRTSTLSPTIQLAHQAERWPTARQEDGESCGNHPGSQDSLTGVTKNWPTPIMADGRMVRGGKRGPELNPTLTQASTNWPTPNAHDGTGARGPGFELTDGHTRPHDLVAVTSQWPTPAQTMDSGPNNHYRGDSKAGRQLTEESRLWRTPDSPGTGGPRNRQDSIGEGHQITIVAEQAEHWNTPHGMSNKDFRFAKQANNWQTPAQDSFRSKPGLFSNVEELFESTETL
jgi:hypothetical protein